MEYVLDQAGKEMEALRKIGVGLELEFGLFRPRGLSVLHRVSVKPESWTWCPQATVPCCCFLGTSHAVSHSGFTIILQGRGVSFPPRLWKNLKLRERGEVIGPVKGSKCSAGT